MTADELLFRIEQHYRLREVLPYVFWRYVYFPFVIIIAFISPRFISVFQTPSGGLQFISFIVDMTVISACVLGIYLFILAITVGRYLTKKKTILFYSDHLELDGYLLRLRIAYSSYPKNFDVNLTPRDILVIHKRDWLDYFRRWELSDFYHRAILIPAPKGCKERAKVLSLFGITDNTAVHPDG